MEELIFGDLRILPSLLVLATGVFAAIKGGFDMTRGFLHASRQRETPIAFVTGMRVMLAGIAVALIGAAWLWQQVWLLALGLAFGLEELWETSVVIFALRRGKRLEAEAASRRTVAP
jgi:hypothetical protein